MSAPARRYARWTSSTDVGAGEDQVFVAAVVRRTAVLLGRQAHLLEHRAQRAVEDEDPFVERFFERLQVGIGQRHRPKPPSQRGPMASATVTARS